MLYFDVVTQLNIEIQYVFPISIYTIKHLLLNIYRVVFRTQWNTRFFIRNGFFQLSFNTELYHELNLKCLYLPYLCPYLDLGLFMLYLCDLFFIFIFIIIFIMINRMISWLQTHLFFLFFFSCILFRTCPNNFGWYRR